MAVAPSTLGLDCPLCDEHRELPVIRIDERDVWKYTWSGVAWARLFATTRMLKRTMRHALLEETPWLRKLLNRLNLSYDGGSLRPEASLPGPPVEHSPVHDAG